MIAPFFFRFDSKDVRLFVASLFIAFGISGIYWEFFAPKPVTTFDSGSISNIEKTTTGTTSPIAFGTKEIFVIEDISPKPSAPPESMDPVEILSPPKPKKNVPTPALSFSFRPETIKIDDRIIELLRRNLLAKPFREKVVPLAVTVDAERTEPRWQVTGNQLILSSSISTDSETMKVLVHELGHVVDIHYLKSSGGVSGDPSDDFYALSWDSYQTKKKWAKLSDFVSGYALSNKYEDFAESFTFYVFHNAEFKKRALKNSQLAKKYAFFNKKVFTKAEFVSTSFSASPLKAYLWDTTKPRINTKKYLFYIQ